MSRIAVSRILYCETQGNYQIITTEDEEIATRLSAWKMREALCAFPGFINIGSAYIINLQKIVSLRNGSALMEHGGKLTFSSKRFLELKEKYFDFFAANISVNEEDWIREWRES